MFHHKGLVSTGGKVMGMWDFGFYTFAMCVFVCNLRLYLMTR